MKKILALILFMFISSLIFAQTNFEDVVYLKNGSVIRGMIIEQIPNVSIKIQTKSENVFVYKMDEVLKITKEEVFGDSENSNRQSKTRKPFTFNEIKKRGYTLNIEPFYCYGNQKALFTQYGRYWDGTSNLDLTSTGTYKRKIGTFGISIVNGYQFTHKITLGIGIEIGISKPESPAFKDYDSNENIFQNLHSQYSYQANVPTFAPLFANINYNLFEAKSTPFINFSIGYDINYFLNSSQNKKGGIYLNSVLGYKVFLLKKLALNFSVGYKFQQFNSTGNDYSYDELYYYGVSMYEKFTLNQLFLKAGLTF